MKSDRQLLSDTQAVLGELVLRSESLLPASIPVAVFDGGIALDGFDLPGRVQAENNARVTFRWRAETDIGKDYSQFLHFLNEEGDTLWNYDQQPLGPRLPTRLWYRGMAAAETWTVPLPADLAPGLYAVFTGLYSLSDQERLPASGIDGTPFPHARVPLGTLTIE